MDQALFEMTIFNNIYKNVVQGIILIQLLATKRKYNFFCCLFVDDASLNSSVLYKLLLVHDCSFVSFPFHYSMD